jgi:AraC family transcriptional regulator of arabinose operon
MVKDYAMIKDECIWPEEVRVGEVIYPPGGTFGPRLQRNLQLILIHSGHMTVWIDGVQHIASTGTVCVLFPGHEERFAFAEECETWHSWLHVFLPRPSETLLSRLARLPWPLPLSSSMTDLMHEALVLRNSPLSTAATLQKALAIQMIWRYIGEGELQMAGATVPVDSAVESAIQFISAHLDEPLTLAMIAEAAAVSPPHLIRLFRSQLNTTPMAYLWERRVTMGLELLRQTGLGVAEIAQRCGFQTSHHFSRRVRQATGLAPLEVRQQACQG